MAILFRIRDLHAKAGLPDMHDVRERLTSALCLGIDMVPNRPQLHHDKRIVSVIPHDSCRKPQHISAWRSIHNGFKGFRPYDMTLIDNYLPIFLDTWIDKSLAT